MILHSELYNDTFRVVVTLVVTVLSTLLFTRSFVVACLTTFTTKKICRGILLESILL